MAYRVIELPGVRRDPGRTSWAKTSFDSIRILGRRDEPVCVTVVICNYSPSHDDAVHRYFHLQFSGVLEYRYIDEIVSYEDQEAHRHDFEFGLIEILDSAYIENMASKGRRGNYPIGQRFGKFDPAPGSGGIAESEVRHFRLAFDKWGRLDVIALHLSIEPASSG